MPASLIVASILVLGWNLTLIVAALVTGTGPFQSQGQMIQEMSRSQKPVRAEIGKPELDARTNSWKRETGIGLTASVQSRLIETEQEVTVQAPYAEASVTVSGDDGREARRCSVCMN
jgi:hypothetical protein